MKTAKTTQILDANNNNISPATNIESLYFEKTEENGVTYRMGIRDRMLIAGGNTLVGQPQLNIGNKILKIPYTYVSSITGAQNIY